jgi:hypothetical protein
MMEETEKELMSIDLNSNYAIELFESLKRLENNEDFKKVILNGYMNEKVLDSVSLLAEPGIKKQNARGDIMEDLVAISNLGYYFKMVKRFGSLALDDRNKDESPMTSEEY